MAESFKERQAKCLSRIRQIDAKAFSFASQVGFGSIEHVLTRLSIAFDNAIEHFDVATYYLLTEAHLWRSLGTIPAEKGLAEDKEMLEGTVPKCVEVFTSNLRTGLGKFPLAKELADDVAHEFKLKLMSKLYLCLDMLERYQPLPDLEAFSREVAQGPMRSRADWWKARLARRSVGSPRVSDVPQSADLEALKGTEATEEHNEPQAAQNTTEAADREAEKRELSLKRSASWESVRIVFVSDSRVQVFNGIERESYNYNELGFEDGRKETPNQAWLTLRRLAELGGTISNGGQLGCDWKKVEKRIQAIRKTLRGHFGITADPVPFIAGTGYQAAFRITVSRSFDS